MSIHPRAMLAGGKQKLVYGFYEYEIVAIVSLNIKRNMMTRCIIQEMGKGM